MSHALVLPDSIGGCADAPPPTLCLLVDGRRSGRRLGARCRRAGTSRRHRGWSTRCARAQLQAHLGCARSARVRVDGLVPVCKPSPTPASAPGRMFQRLGLANSASTQASGYRSEPDPIGNSHHPRSSAAGEAASTLVRHEAIPGWVDGATAKADFRCRCISERAHNRGGSDRSGRGPGARSRGRSTFASAGQSRRDVSVRRDDRGSS